MLARRERGDPGDLVSHHTLEAQGVVASPQVDRALAAELIARTYVLGAHNHLYMAMGARGVIAAYGKRTYVENVLEGSGEWIA